MSTFPEIERRDNPPMPYEEYRARELRTFAKQLVIAFFVVGVPLAILVWPWGGK
jgi:hypothetical protein